MGDTLASLREPAAPGVTILLAGGACWFLRRRDGRTAGLWAGAFAAAFAIEAVLKVVVDQRMPGIPREVTAIGTVSPGSYPSGHATRAVLLAGVGAVLWPPLRRWLVGWVAVVAAGIVLLGMHLLTDVAGGLLLGCLIVLLVRAFGPPPGPAGGDRRPPSTLFADDPSSRDERALTPGDARAIVEP